MLFLFGDARKSRDGVSRPALAPETSSKSTPKRCCPRSPPEHAFNPVDRVHLARTLGLSDPYSHRSFSDDLVNGLPRLGGRL